MSANAGNNRILDEIHGVSRARILRLAVVVVVWNTRVGIERNVLEHAAKAQRIPNLGLVLLRQLDALRVASAFEVEHAVSTPAMLVVADQIARRVRRKRGLACAREPEK